MKSLFRTGSDSRTARTSLPLAVVSAFVMILCGCATTDRASELAITASGVSASLKHSAATFPDRIYTCRQHSNEEACLAFARKVAAASCHDAVGAGNVNYSFCSLCVATPPTNEQWARCLSLAQSIARSSGGTSIDINYDPSRPVSHTNVPPGATQDPEMPRKSLALPSMARDDPSVSRSQSQQTQKKSGGGMKKK